MKKIFSGILIALLTLLFTANCAYAAKPIIKSDKQYLDFKTGLYVLKGNVYIEVGNRIIKAGEARVDMLSMEVWGSGGITLTQDDIFFSGNSVYVYGKEKRAEISGNVHYSRTNLLITADKVDYSWKTFIAEFSGNVTTTTGNDTSGMQSQKSNLIKYHVKNNEFLNATSIPLTLTTAT